METLEDKLRFSVPEDFPGDRKDDYIRYYENAVKFLRPIQLEAGSGAMAADIKAKIEAGGAISADEILHLNNHGPEHIKCVIDRCSRLVKETIKDSDYDVHGKKINHGINGYEAYVLLVAINLHDAGNVEGREGHEKKIFSYIQEMGELLGNDNAEKKLIGKIAAVHGGRISGSKDTIKTLSENQHILGRSLDCRFLAALVRFADELADDSTRASRFMLENNLISEDSEIYHQYSVALTSVHITRSDLNLSYHVDHEIAIKQFKKVSSQVFLVDEIFERMLKMHLERIYCTRYLKHRLDIGPIRFQLEVSHPNDHFATSEYVTGTLQETGFPDAPVIGLKEICPELEKLDGLTICHKIEEMNKAHDTV